MSMAEGSEVVNRFLGLGDLRPEYLAQCSGVENGAYI